MTTADGMQPVFSGRHPKLFLISDFYRVDTEVAEVNADIARSLLMPIIPLYLNKKVYVMSKTSVKKRLRTRIIELILKGFAIMSITLVLLEKWHRSSYYVGTLR